MEDGFETDGVVEDVDDGKACFAGICWRLPSDPLDGVGEEADPPAGIVGVVSGAVSARSEPDVVWCLQQASHLRCCRGAAAGVASMDVVVVMVATGTIVAVVVVVKAIATVEAEMVAAVMVWQQRR